MVRIERERAGRTKTGVTSIRVVARTVIKIEEVGTKKEGALEGGIVIGIEGTVKERIRACGMAVATLVGTTVQTKTSARRALRLTNCLVGAVGITGRQSHERKLHYLRHTLHKIN